MALGRVVLIFFLLLLLGDRGDDHLSCQRRESRGNVDVLLRTHPERFKEAVLLCELTDPLLSLQVVEVGLVHLLDFVDFVDAQNDRDRGTTD